MARQVHWLYEPEVPAEVREAVHQGLIGSDADFEPEVLHGMTACGKRAPTYERQYWPFEATTDDALVTCRRCLAARAGAARA